MPSGVWRAQAEPAVVQECEPDAGRWGGMCVCKHICVYMCGLAYISALHSPPHTPPLDSKLGHIRVCVHSSVGPDRGLGEGRVLSAPVSTP